MIFPILALWGRVNVTEPSSLSKSVGAYPIGAGSAMAIVGGAATFNMASLGYQFGLHILIDPTTVLIGLIPSILLVKKI